MSICSTNINCTLRGIFPYIYDNNNNNNDNNAVSMLWAELPDTMI